MSDAPYRPIDFGVTAVDLRPMAGGAVHVTARTPLGSYPARNTDRATTMRRKELAEAEGEAGEKDQSMRLAQILIGFGFIVFLTYPAVINVLAF